MLQNEKQNKDEKEPFYLVNAKEWDEMKQRLEKVTASPPKDQTLGDYVPENEAKILVRKSTTWFWYARQGQKKVNGVIVKLPYTLPSAKIGNKRFYRKADLLKILDDSLIEKS